MMPVNPSMDTPNLEDSVFNIAIKPPAGNWKNSLLNFVTQDNSVCDDFSETPGTKHPRDSTKKKKRSLPTVAFDIC